VWTSQADQPAEARALRCYLKDVRALELEVHVQRVRRLLIAYVPAHSQRVSSDKIQSTSGGGSGGAYSSASASISGSVDDVPLAVPLVDDGGGGASSRFLIATITLCAL
jgi:hypothetical protein